MRPIDRELMDAAQRASDVINTYIAHRGWDELKDKWLAFRMDTGENDANLYDSKRDAVRHQANEFQRFYISFRGLGPGGSNARELAIVFGFQREAYKAGFRLPDPDADDGGPEVLMTSARYDFLNGRAPR